MQTWLGKKLIDLQFLALRHGDPLPSLVFDGRDVELTFPGAHSWSGVYRGKVAHRRRIERFCRSGLQIFADEVVVKGFPWRTTICIRGRDSLDDGSGERVYESRYAIWARLRWGMLRDYEVYEDTQKVAALDEWMARTGHAAAGGVVA
jgi:ketosteroid isomerase-like protein